MSEIIINEVVTTVDLTVNEIITTQTIIINETPGIIEIVAGTNVTVDNTNPLRPIVSASGGGGGGAVDSVNGQTGIVELGLQEITDVNSTTNKPLRVQVGSEYSEIKEDGLHLKNNLTAATAHLDGSLISADITLQVPNQAGVKVIATDEDLDTKQDTLVSGTNIKTINGSSVLGSGNLVVGGTSPDATDTVKGIAKLYPSLGTNTDGAPTQAIVKTNLDSKESIGQQSSVSWTGAQVVDWNNIVVKATLTGATTLTETNLPTSPNTRIIEIWIKGNFALTLPSGWTAQKGNDTYNGLVMNRFIIECTNLGGTEDRVYTLINMTV